MGVQSQIAQAEERLKAALVELPSTTSTEALLEIASDIADDYPDIMAVRIGSDVEFWPEEE